MNSLPSTLLGVVNAYEKKMTLTFMSMPRAFTLVEERKVHIHGPKLQNKKIISSGSRMYNVGMNAISTQE